ncbi:hypothetical protein LPJ64_004335, partial [Coemansia asiatica]
MSAVGSDSEVEEIVETRKITPRFVRRPQSAGRRETLHAAETDDDSEDSDDASFFTLGGRKASNVYSSEDEIEQMSQVEQQVEQNVVNKAIRSGFSSESEEDEREQEQVESVSDREVSEVRGTKRARSVSLTPPPSARQSEKNRRLQRREEAVVLVDDEVSVVERVNGGKQATAKGSLDAAMSDLDPSLLAAIAGTDAVGGAVLEKVQIEFRLVYDEHFLYNDVQVTWIDKRWRRVKRTDHSKIRKKLDERTAVVVFSTDFVSHALQVFSDNFPVDIVATDPVLMQGSTRVFTTSRLVSLGNDPVHYIYVYPRSVYNRMKAEEALALQRRADEQAQMLKEMEIARELRRNAVEVPELGTEQAAIDGIRIKIRDHDGKDTLLMVAPTTTVQSIIDGYRKMADLANDVKIRLEFDDEGLDPKSTVGETDIEDDDMLTVYCR